MAGILGLMLGASRGAIWALFAGSARRAWSCETPHSGSTRGLCADVSVAAFCSTTSRPDANERAALAVPIERATRMAQECGAGELGRVAAVQNGSGDVGREEGEAEQPGDVGPGHALTLRNLRYAPQRHWSAAWCAALLP